MDSKQAVDYAKSQALEHFGAAAVPDLQLHACELHTHDFRWIVVLSYAATASSKPGYASNSNAHLMDLSRMYKKVHLSHQKPEVIAISTHDTAPDTDPR